MKLPKLPPSGCKVKGCPRGGRYRPVLCVTDGRLLADGRPETLRAQCEFLVCEGCAHSRKVRDPQSYFDLGARGASSSLRWDFLAGQFEQLTGRAPVYSASFVEFVEPSGRVLRELSSGLTVIVQDPNTLRANLRWAVEQGKRAPAS
jgi:hypothetical protein